MRPFRPALGLALLAALVGLAAGCNSMRFNFARPGEHPESGKPAPPGTPSVAGVVAYLNDNARRVETLQVTSLEVTAAQGAERINLRGKMVAHKPRGFRMSLDGPLGFTQVADLGSNDKEFWFWIKAAPGSKQVPYQYYCSYQDLERGVQFLPIPFQPEWLMEVLGLGPYGPPERYQIERDDKTPTLRLVERTRSPQGGAVRKVIVMKARETRAPEPQVTHHLLIDDATNREICSAVITQTMIDPATGAILPRKLDLNWRQENATLSLFIDKAAVNVPLQPQAFVRTPLKGVQSFNLATSRPDPPGLQQVQGFVPGARQ